MPGPRDLLAQLVAFPSVSSASTRPIAEFLCDRLDRPGAVIERNEDSGGAKVNLVARLGPEPDAARGGLILSGHLDVVPADEPGWRSDPFRLREEDGRWYGRDTCDMKGFIAVAVELFTAVEADALRQPLVLLFSFDEELGSLGARHLAATWPAAALPARAVRMHKGHLAVRLTVAGRSAHSGSPHLGRNAIAGAGAVLGGLEALRAALAAERSATSRWFPEVPYPVLNVARIAGGTAANVVPDRCEILIGIRLLPGGDAGAVLDRVRAAAAAAKAGFEPPVMEVINDNPPMLLEEGAEIHRRQCGLLGQDRSFGVSFASDAGVLQRDLAIDCVLFGPGSIEDAHRPDEFVPIADLVRTREVLHGLIERCCRA